MTTTAPTPQTAVTSAGVAVKATVSGGTPSTEYVVLEQVARPENISWAEFARETARSADAAVKAALEGNTDGGTFVAIPARSWKPVKVTPQVVTTLKLEEAK